MTDFKAGAELGKAVGVTSTKGTFGMDIKKQPPKKKKKNFKAGAELATNV